MGYRKAVAVGKGLRGAATRRCQKPSSVWASLMRILLTGADGQVGGALQPLLAGHGTIIAPTVAEFDLAKPETLAAKLDSFRPDVIINPAAYTAVDRAEDDRELAFLINAGGPG